MTREEPSLETWLKNIRMMDKVQITDRSSNLWIENTRKIRSEAVHCLTVKIDNNGYLIHVMGEGGPKHVSFVKKGTMKKFKN
jgi:hypothetical protein